MSEPPVTARGVPESAPPPPRTGCPPSLWRRLACVIGLAASSLLPAPALGTHAPDHRFVVLGYVTDDQGQPVAGATVVVTRLKTGLEQSTRTEADGLYLVVLHLHDEDEGERLGVSARGVKGEVRARFDVRETRFERGTRADIRGDRLVETRQAFAETLRDYLKR